MKFSREKILWVLCVLCALAVNGYSLDREAFSITKYNLNLQIDPAQHRLGVRGKITLRNDTSTPQKIAVLQISSSLDWRSIKAADKMLQFVSQPLMSDIDHTGSLSEAIVTLPREVPPHATVDLDIAYEGVIILDATRLKRVGTPDAMAANTDWDEIDENFTAVRGAGYVAWYPLATESADLSEGNDLSEALGRWKAREGNSQMSLLIESTKDCKILFSGSRANFLVTTDKPVKIGAFTMAQLNGSVPTFVLADYKTIDAKGGSTVNFLAGTDETAASYADLFAHLDPLSARNGPVDLQVAQLPQLDAVPFVSDNLVLMPLRPLTDESRLTVLYAVARQRITSPRAWINEGLAHFAQAVDIEQQHSRQAALDYMNAHGPAFISAEKKLASPDSATNNSLINTTDEVYLQSKAMWVWSMLRDMIGDASLNIALFSYHAPEDKEPSYMPRLISAHTQRDLEWFFDDWVYRDRGLPDFKVESAYAHKTMTNSYMLTITVDNLGTAGAEVPVVIQMKGGEVTRRVEVRAKGKATIRIETPAAPQEIRINDGSVPESDLTNNSFRVEPPQS